MRRQIKLANRALSAFRRGREKGSEIRIGKGETVILGHPLPYTFMAIMATCLLKANIEGYASEMDARKKPELRSVYSLPIQRFCGYETQDVA